MNLRGDKQTSQLKMTKTSLTYPDNFISIDRINICCRLGGFLELHHMALQILVWNLSRISRCVAEALGLKWQQSSMHGRIGDL